MVHASGTFRSPYVEKRRVRVNIPAGVEDGQTLRQGTYVVFPSPVLSSILIISPPQSDCPWTAAPARCL